LGKTGLFWGLCIKGYTHNLSIFTFREERGSRARGEKKNLIKDFFDSVIGSVHNLI